ncbi:MAG TPA: cytochrome c oxidase subunit I [Polyangiaceae bacterium]|nr:cytochrome c oxidase subunit I [Polyangiaceae bacterium]
MTESAIDPTATHASVPRRHSQDLELAADEPEREADRTPLTRELRRTWQHASGFWGWFQEVSSLVIGLRTIVTAFAFFALGGLEALLMRLQLARPDAGLIDADTYSQLFSTHGTTMMFLFGVPLGQGLAIYLVPLMLGTRSLIFPRLNAYAYHTYLIGGLLLYTGLALRSAPDAGWFSYVPLAGKLFSHGKRVDIWAQTVTFTELASLAIAANVIVTVLKTRAPGMSLSRIPLFVWAQLVTSFMILFAMPAVMVASTMLATDRLVNTQFFNAAAGGDPLLWQHLFWFFGHPEVYIIFLPALGVVSAIVETFAGRAIIGYVPMVLSLVVTGFMGFGLWVHHMFATGLPQIGQSFFTASSMIIAIPTGIQIFCWIATLWRGKLVLKTPLLFVLGFIGTFVIGGLTGVMLASVPLNVQVHDTFFVVAHLHYVLIGGAVFPVLGGIYYWFPKFSGRFLDERLGLVNFILIFLGFQLTFFPMHVLGLQGMPRRIYTYSAETGWQPLNFLATIGAVVLGLGVLCLVLNVILSLRSGARAGANPWRAASLEWSASSPPEPFSFGALPSVAGRQPLWEAERPEVSGLETKERAVLVTDALDARPDHRYLLPGPSNTPFLAAVATAVMFIGLIFTPWAVPVGALLLGAVLTSWFWPRRPADELLEQQP